MITLLLTTILLFVLGACIGSFINVVLYRSVYGQSWWWGRSACEACHKMLHWFDEVPVLSYLFLGGKCRFCRTPIALSHPVIEFLTGILFVWWYFFGTFFFRLVETPFQMLQPLFWLSVGVLLIMVIMADLLYLLIPDVTVGLLLLLTIGYRLSLTLTGIMRLEDLIKSVVGMVLVVCFFGGLWLITKGKGMGLGDVKLMIPLSLLMGWPKMIVGVTLAFALGAIVGLALMAIGWRKPGQVIPFGPFLVIGSVVALVFGGQMIEWYMRFI